MPLNSDQRYRRYRGYRRYRNRQHTCPQQSILRTVMRRAQGSIRVLRLRRRWPPGRLWPWLCGHQTTMWAPAAGARSAVSTPTAARWHRSGASGGAPTGAPPCGPPLCRSSRLAGGMTKCSARWARSWSSLGSMPFDGPCVVTQRSRLKQLPRIIAGGESTGERA